MESRNRVGVTSVAANAAFVCRSNVHLKEVPAATDAPPVHPTFHPRRPRFAVWLVTVATSALLALMLAHAPVRAATSTLNVSLDVVSSTQLSIAACPASARTLGTVLPDATAITTSDCSITFGSSNDLAHLRAVQRDGTGAPMWTWSAGTPDPSWKSGATNGLVERSHASAYIFGGLAIDRDGNAYRGARAVSTTRLGVARFTPAGAFDSAWNGDGYGTTNALPNGVMGMQTAIDSQGRIVLAGMLWSTPAQVVVARLTSAGNVDTGFGGGDGWVSFDPDPAATDNFVAGLMIDSADRPWIGGCVESGGTNPCMYSNGTGLFAARVTTDGSLDSTFATGGVYLRASAGSTATGTLAPSSTGGAYLVGRDGLQAIVVKLDRTGKPDPAWGTAGVSATQPFGATHQNAWAALELEDGSVFVGGTHGGYSSSYLQKLTPAGTLDLGWGGGDGVVQHNLFASNEYAISGSLIPTGDGGVFISGDYWAGSDDAIWVARLRADGSLHPDFGTGGVATVNMVLGSTFLGGMAARDGQLYVGAGDAGAGAKYTIARFAQTNQAIANYAHPTTTFATASGAFGACARSVTTATPTWIAAPAGSCAGDGVHWNGIARATNETGAEIAATTTAGTLGTVALRFGVRAPLTAAPGAYMAPITFDVIAP